MPVSPSTSGLGWIDTSDVVAAPGRWSSRAAVTPPTPAVATRRMPPTTGSRPPTCTRTCGAAPAPAVRVTLSGGASGRASVAAALIAPVAQSISTYAVASPKRTTVAGSPVGGGPRRARRSRATSAARDRMIGRRVATGSWTIRSMASGSSPSARRTPRVVRRVASSGEAVRSRRAISERRMRTSGRTAVATEPSPSGRTTQRSRCAAYARASWRTNSAEPSPPSSGRRRSARPHRTSGRGRWRRRPTSQPSVTPKRRVIATSRRVRTFGAVRRT